MTHITSQKDQLFTTLHEFTSAQQRADKARSDMHCIIAALPDEEKPRDTGTPITPSGNARERPVVTPTLPGVAEVEPIPKTVSKSKASASKVATTRMNSLEKKARVQVALLYRAENPHLNLEQVAAHHGLELKALSRSYAQKLKKAMSPHRNMTPKDVADDFLYNEKRRKK